MVANVGSGIAFVLSIAWAVLVWADIPWVYSQSMIVSFTSSLTKVTTRHGTVSHLMSMTGKLVGASGTMKQFDDMMEQTLWYQDALPHFCAAGMEFLFKWCNNWTVIVYSSWAMIGLGMLTSILLFVGAGSTYYYANVHPTKTGRTLCSWCYIVAPVTAAAGLASFTLATSDYGRDGSHLFDGYHQESMYAIGFVLCSVLILATCIPIFTLLVFMRRDPLEHSHEEDDEGPLLQGYQQGYGAGAQGAQAYPPGAAQAQPYYPPVPPGGPAMHQPGTPYPKGP